MLPKIFHISTKNNNIWFAFNVNEFWFAYWYFYMQLFEGVIFILN